MSTHHEKKTERLERVRPPVGELQTVNFNFQNNFGVAADSFSLQANILDNPRDFIVESVSGYCMHVPTSGATRTVQPIQVQLVDSLSSGWGVPAGWNKPPSQVVFPGNGILGFLHGVTLTQDQSFVPVPSLRFYGGQGLAVNVLGYGSFAMGDIVEMWISISFREVML